jgi:hypothetical protein
MKMKPWMTRIIAIVLMIGILFLAQRLVMPKYNASIIEGGLIGEYYTEKTGHDVIFIGDCEVYENFSPITLWNQNGITSYIRGSAQQLMWQSYYLLEETLQYEKPRVVLLSIIAMKYNEPQKETYNRMTLDGMRLSLPKLRSIKASMLEGEQFIEYLFPILRFHARWSELTGNDFKYLFQKGKMFHNGYYMRVDVKPVTTIPTGKKLPDYHFGDRVLYYLEQVTKLCKENNIALILVKAPTIYPFWYDEWDAQMEEYAAENGHLYLNFLELTDQVGIDFNKDTYDAGLHMNLSGAEKMSVYIGKILQDEYGIADRRDDEKLSLIWQEKTDFYNKMRDAQYAELAQYGYLKNFGARPADDITE